jgi:hypothetical protein
MPLHRVGAIASFVLTVQFVLTILWIVMSWPEDGFTGLADAMADYFKSHANQPVSFAILNLYNVSFAISALVLAVIMRHAFADYPIRMQLAVYLIIVAASLYVASGVVPLVGAPELIELGDESAIRVMIVISTGLLLAATMASGFALALFAWVALVSKRLPVLLCVLLLVASAMEILEFAVPIFLFLDPFSGSVWSLWLGYLLWSNRVTFSNATVD